MITYFTPRGSEFIEMCKSTQLFKEQIDFLDNDDIRFFDVCPIIFLRELTKNS